MMEDAYVLHLVDCSEGVKLAVHSYGGCGPALLLLHCNGVGARVYEPLLQPLLQSFRVFAADLRGHGSSPLPPGATIDWELIAKDVLCAVEQLSLEDCYIFAHSLGGGTALRAEEMQPGTFAGMFLFEPIAPPPDDMFWPIGTRMMAATARKRRRRFPSGEEVISAYGTKPPLSVLDRRCLELYVRHGFREVAGGGIELCCLPEVEAAIFESSARALAGAFLDRVACPVVIAVGGQDASDGPALIAPGIAAKIPRSRMQTFPTLGHLGPLQEPETVAAAVREALLGSTSSGASAEERRQQEGRAPQQAGGSGQQQQDRQQREQSSRGGGRASGGASGGGGSSNRRCGAAATGAGSIPFVTSRL